MSFWPTKEHWSVEIPLHTEHVRMPVLVAHKQRHRIRAVGVDLRQTTASGLVDDRPAARFAQLKDRQ